MKHHLLEWMSHLESVITITLTLCKISCLYPFYLKKLYTSFVAATFLGHPVLSNTNTSIHALIVVETQFRVICFVYRVIVRTYWMTLVQTNLTI